MDQAKKMAKIAFEALEDKKGEDVCAIDISAVSVLADYFVIANGNSDSQVRALVENVEEIHNWDIAVHHRTRHNHIPDI